MSFIMQLNSENTDQPIVSSPNGSKPFVMGSTDGLNEIYCESNLETMSRMPDGFVDLTVTSPPYDGMRKYNGYSFPFEEIATELYRITKDGGLLVWVVGDATKDGSESGTSFKQALYFMQLGFNIHDTMIFAKNSMVLTHNRYEQDFEFMFVFSKGKPKTFNPLTIKTKEAGRVKRYNYITGTTGEKGAATRSGMDRSVTVKETKYRGNIWFYPVGSNCSSMDEIAFNHPAIFPEQLAADHIYSWSNEGDIVYDCFGGSGTTAKMAHIQKRNWILSEISKEYCQIAEKRIAPYLAQTSLF